MVLRYHRKIKRLILGRYCEIVEKAIFKHAVI
jgi:hypothetical protein